MVVKIRNENNNCQKILKDDKQIKINWFVYLFIYLYLISNINIKIIFTIYIVWMISVIFYS